MSIIMLTLQLSIFGAVLAIGLAIRSKRSG